MSQRILYLTNADSERLAAWLSHFEIVPPGINKGRFFSMQIQTTWISAKELKSLNDNIQPYGLATDIIRGGVVLTSVEELVV